MRGKPIKKIELPKGYVNIDEVYMQLDRIEREEDCEYGDYGEVLSEWATCDYGEVLDAISCCNVTQAISLDQIKQAREEIESHKYDEGAGFDDFSDGYIKGLFMAVEIIEKLIEEVKE